MITINYIFLKEEMICDLMNGIGFFTYDINKSTTNQPLGLYQHPEFKKAVLDPSNVMSAAASVDQQLQREADGIELPPAPLLLPFRYKI